MPSVTYAQNGEDIVLWRALGHVECGRYVDVGANHPVETSVTYLFYEQGWSGVAVEPVPHYASLLRAARPRDTVVEAAAGFTDEVVVHEVVGTGLSTTVDEYAATQSEAGREVRDVTVAGRTLADIGALPAARDAEGDTHLLTVDVEGAEAEVLASADLSSWRPWVVVVEATRPDSTVPSHEAWEPELLAAGYGFCLFDGLSRFYLAEEHDELRPALSYPACPQDGFVRLTELRLAHQVNDLERRLDEVDDSAAELREALLHWRAEALRAYRGTADAETVRHLEEELSAMRSTVSWRVTAPLRGIRRTTTARTPR